MISNRISDQINRTLKRTAGIANISELQETHSWVFVHGFQGMGKRTNKFCHLSLMMVVSFLNRVEL